MIASNGFRAACVCLITSIGCGTVKSSATDAASTDDSAHIDASVDATPDATPDAVPDAFVSLAKYDVAYVNELTFATNISSISGFVLVINKGSTPLKISTTSVVMFSDDNAQLVWTFVKGGTPTATLAPNAAAGDLSPLATTKIVDSGLATESIADHNLDFGMSFSNVPNTGFNLNAQATIQIDGKNIVLPFTIHFVVNATTAFNNASRISTP